MAAIRQSQKVLSEGLEPSPNRLKAGCATLTPRKLTVAMSGIEPLPKAYETSVLPLYYTAVL